MDACKANCEKSEAHGACAEFHIEYYECMSVSGYECIGDQLATHGACQAEYRVQKQCEDVAATPPGGEAMRVACHARCADAEACLPHTPEAKQECRMFCDRDVANTFPECVSLATRAAECEINGAYACRDGVWIETNPDPCESAWLASEACQRDALKCEGADENGDCPAVSCTCYGELVSYAQPQIIGKTCKCPDFNECMRHICPY